MKIKSLIAILLVWSFVYSCSRENKKHQEGDVVVKVYDKYLYKSDLRQIVPKGESAEDSANIVQTYINNWIQNQLMLHFAEEYLQSQKKEIEEKTEDFKNALLIHQFKLKLVEVNTDSLVNMSDVEQYYNSHYNELLLHNNIVKGYLLRVPKDAKGLTDFKKLLSHSDGNDLDAIIGYVKSVGGKFDDFTRQWVQFSSVIMKMPLVVENENDYFKKNQIEVTDGNNFYYMSIIKRAKKGTVAPLDYAKSRIMKILSQKKSSAIVEKFKEQKYKEALKKGEIVFYD
jgi:hypothetical protein